MEVTIKNVKEISLVTNYVIFNYDPNAYTDLLRISNGRIFYNRKNFHTHKTVAEWSYKTTSREFSKKWDNLISTFRDELNCQNKICNVRTDCGSFNIKVSFKDGTHVDISGISDLFFSNLNNQANAFFDMIPAGEVCPDFIKPFTANFYEENLTKKDIETIDLKTVNSIMYAEAGAMGTPGLIEITTDKDIRFSNREKSDINQTEVFDLFNEMPLFNSSEIITKPFMINNDFWYYVGLGAGNHLYLRDDLYFKIANQIFDVNDYCRYVNWRRIFKND